MKAVIAPPGFAEDEVEEWTWTLERIRTEGQPVSSLPTHDPDDLRQWTEQELRLSLEPNAGSPGLKILGDAGNATLALLWGQAEDGDQQTWLLASARQAWGDRCYALIHRYPNFDPITTSMVTYQGVRSNRWSFFGLDLVDTWTFNAWFQPSDDLLDDPAEDDADGANSSP